MKQRWLLKDSLLCSTAALWYIDTYFPLLFLVENDAPCCQQQSSLLWERQELLPERRQCEGCGSVWPLRHAAEQVQPRSQPQTHCLPETRCLERPPLADHKWQEYRDKRWTKEKEKPEPLREARQAVRDHQICRVPNQHRATPGDHQSSWI